MGLDSSKLIELHKALLLVRHCEETLASRYKEQEMRTPTHFGIGQEAVAVGVCAALTRDDLAFSHHRCHNHYLAKGGSLLGLVAELYGRENGCSAGRGGSVHLTDRRVGLVATSAIVGEMVSVATGAALALQMDKDRRVAVSFFGDGTFEEGIVYECFNYASIRKLPVLFVCENNLYSTESPLSIRRPAGTEYSERARAFKIKAETVDGNDVAAVYQAAAAAVAELRQGGGPAFLECMTYRWREHVGPQFDHELGRIYRTREEVESWMERCPIKRSGERLVQDGAATTADLDRWSAETLDLVQKTIETARQSKWPDPKTLLENVV